jgi:hypothetical protein
VEVGEVGRPEAVVFSRRVMGNGELSGIRDLVYVRPETFQAAETPAVALEVASINARLLEQKIPYVLLGFGRWGSADPWLGVPVTWPQIAGARAIVEAATAEFQPDMSQGAHFFHNLLGFGVVYLSVPAQGGGRIDWDWLEALPRPAEGRWVCRAESPEPLTVRADGRSGRAVVLRLGENRHG